MFIMGRRLDESGKMYGRLKVLSPAKNPGKYKTTSTFWLCKCACGKEKVIRTDHLRNGRAKSCGHCSRPYILERNGCSKHPLFNTWNSMMFRCYNENSERYKDYGGRGIEVYKKWQKDPNSFFQWIEENLGPRQEGHSLDRINVYGNYEPGNLKWSNAEEQMRNRRLVLLSEEEYELIMHFRNKGQHSEDEALCVGA